jgi:hypothetical protein
MPRYQATVASRRPAPDTFGYLATFSNAAEWDPGVISAGQLDPGPVRPGTRFRLIVPFHRRHLRDRPRRRHRAGPARRGRALPRPRPRPGRRCVRADRRRVVWLATAGAGRLGSGRFWHNRRPRAEHRLPWTREAPGAAQLLWDRIDSSERLGVPSALGE